MPVFIYADGIILLNLIKYAMQKLLDIATFSQTNVYRLHFNSQNWKTLFGVNGIGDPLQINDAPLLAVTAEKQLGHVLSINLISSRI